MKSTTIQREGSGRSQKRYFKAGASEANCYKRNIRGQRNPEVKTKEATLEIGSLNKLVQEGKEAFSQKEREPSDLEGRFKKVQLAHTQLQSDLKTAQHDIDGLQQKVNAKDVLIDRIKTSRSENQKRLKAVEGRAIEMEKTKSALNTSLQTTKTRLDKIEGYATQHSDCDEDSM